MEDPHFPDMVSPPPPAYCPCSLGLAPVGGSPLSVPIPDRVGRKSERGPAGFPGSVGRAPPSSALFHAWRLFCAPRLPRPWERPGLSWASAACRDQGSSISASPDKHTFPGMSCSGSSSPCYSPACQGSLVSPMGRRSRAPTPCYTPHRLSQSPGPDTIAPAPGTGLCADGRLRPCPQAPAVRATEKPPSSTGPALAWANAQAWMAAPVPEDNSDSLCQAPQGFDL